MTKEQCNINRYNTLKNSRKYFAYVYLIRREIFHNSNKMYDVQYLALTMYSALLFTFRYCHSRGENRMN